MCHIVYFNNVKRNLGHLSCTRGPPQPKDYHRVQHHLYADDKQAYVDTPVSDVPTARAILQSCITDVGDWCSSHRLQLNETKTELIWFGSKKILGKVPESELNLTVGFNIIQPVKSVRDLGVQLDTELSMKTHVSKVASSCFYQLRHLRQITWFPRSYFPGWTTVTLC